MTDLVMVVRLRAQSRRQIHSSKQAECRVGRNFKFRKMTGLSVIGCIQTVLDSFIRSDLCLVEVDVQSSEKANYKWEA